MEGARGMDTSRIRWIDGTRGLAALAVAVFHYQPLFWPREFLPGGALNVDLFFILSGFVLTHVYREDLTAGRVGWGKFFQNRLARLWPLNVFSILFTAAVAALLWNSLSINSLRTESTFWTAVGSAMLLQDFGLMKGQPWVGSSWSISSEIAVNLIWCALMIGGFWSRRLAMLVIFASIAILLAATGDGVGRQSTLMHVLDFQLFLPLGVVRTAMGFSIGCLLYDARRIPSRYARIVAPLSVAAIVVIETNYSPVTHRLLFELAAIFVAFPALVVSCSSAESVATRLLSSRPLRALGALSFAVYLLHAAVADLMNMSFRFNIGWTTPISGVAYLAMLLSISALVYAGVERPAGRWLRRVRIQPVNSPAVPA